MADEEPSLLRTERGTTAVWRGVNLYPSADPVEYARRKARVFSLSPRTLVFVPSVGLGYGLSDLLARLPPSSAVLCVEAHQPVMALALAQGLPADPRLVVVRTGEPETAVRALQDMGVWHFRRVIEMPLSAGYRLAADLYAAVRRALEQQVHEHWRNKLTLIALGSLQVRNLLMNLPLLAREGDLSSLSTSLPVVVAGAGPSLEGFLPTLRSVRARVVLVAVDTALPRLAAESLLPDVVVTLESQVDNLLDFLPRPGPGILLACDLSSHPAVPRLFESRVRFFSSAFAPLRLFGRMAEARLLPCPFPALGSVGVAAAYLAIRLTRGEIFLAGLDFSYPGSQTHARGTPYHLAALVGATRLSAPDGPSFRALAARPRSQAADKTGRPVATDSVLESYRESLQRIASTAPGRVFDAGATGLDLGVPRINARELEQRVAGPARPGPLEVDRAGPVTTRSLRAFVDAERELLRRGDELLRAALASGSASRECRAILQETDYAWVHFPDQPGDDGPDRSFLARAAVAVGYYRERLRRLDSLL